MSLDEQVTPITGPKEGHSLGKKNIFLLKLIEGTCVKLKRNADQCAILTKT